MHIDTLSAPERRVLGCLIEKRFTTPDQYPLTLNSLRLACNQSTNRDPVVNYDEDTVREAAQRLARYGLTRLASGHSSRAVKYRHMADEVLELGQAPLAVLAVLMLRGAQTPGELKARTERMAELDSLEAVDAVLEELIGRGYVRRLERRPGQKEERYADGLGGPAAGREAAGAEAVGVGGQDGVGSPESRPSGAGAAHEPFRGPDGGGLEARVAALEEQLATVRAELHALRDEVS